MSKKPQMPVAEQSRDMESRVVGAKPIKTAIWGCGAVAEYYYAPALKSLDDTFAVVALFDPSKERTECLKQSFASAAVVGDFDQLPSDTQLVIICSPPKFHV